KTRSRGEPRPATPREPADTRRQRRPSTSTGVVRPKSDATAVSDTSSADVRLKSDITSVADAASVSDTSPTVVRPRSDDAAVSGRRRLWVGALVIVLLAIVGALFVPRFSGTSNAP